VSFFTGNPRPEPRLTNPFAKIYAFTQTKFNGVQQTVIDSINILYSFYTTVNIYPDSTDSASCDSCYRGEPFDIPNGRSLGFKIEVRDIYNHPIMGGSTVSVAVDGKGAELIGDSDFKIPDTNIITPNRPGVTLFFVRLADAEPDSISIIGNSVGVNVKVQSRYNGDASDVSFGKVH
jgi:hypothetical protein